MQQSAGSIDKFSEVWKCRLAYPNSLLRRARPHESHLRDSRREKLQENEDDLFDADQESVEIFDSLEDNMEFSSSTIKSTTAARNYLEEVGTDPQIRHVHLTSTTSRSPLNCSAGTLKTIFTYHQVEDSFLEAVQTFGDQDDPKDLCLAGFRSFDTLRTHDDGLVAIPRLGRSGRNITVSYLMRSVEPKANRDWKWQIRQAAVYHSFDTETGRSLWLTIKGNGEFNSRTKKFASSSNLPVGKESQKAAASHYFGASLDTHLMYLSWCDEHWRDFANDVEDGIRGILEHARKAPIDDHLRYKKTKLAAYPKSLREHKSRSNTMRSSQGPSRNNTGLSIPGLSRRQSTWETVSGLGRSLMGQIYPQQQQSAGDAEKQGGHAAAGLVGNDTSSENLIETQEVLNEFRFCDIQTLYTFSDRIRRAVLTLTLTISMLNELHAYYNELHTSDIENFKHIKTACNDNLIYFLREVKSLNRRLVIRKTQLECLGVLLTEGNTLYDGILQYRQLDIGQRFQETAQESADEMHEIAAKAKLETASMHIITIVTLIFLPATFVATFFQSGVFLWNNDTPKDMTETYHYRGDSLNLFAWVSVPLMVITLGVWLFVYLSMKKKMAQAAKLRQDIEAPLIEAA